jgi:hypothetical protein
MWKRLLSFFRAKGSSQIKIDTQSSGEAKPTKALEEPRHGAERIEVVWDLPDSSANTIGKQVLGLHPKVAADTGTTTNQEFTCFEGGFCARLPGNPTERPNMSADERRNGKTFEVPLEDVAYSIGYFDNPQIANSRLTASEIQDNVFDTMRDGMIGNVQGQLRSEKKITLCEWPGRDYVVDLPHVMPGVLPSQHALMRSRIYLAKQRTYMLVVSGSRDRVASKQADDFFESFKTLPIPEQPAKSTKLATPDSPYVKVYVSKSGEITLNGKATTIDQVECALIALAREYGIVLYSRESPEEYEPHGTAIRVMEIVVQNHLPVRLCVRKDFSDALEANGKLRIGEGPP